MEEKNIIAIEIGSSCIKGAIGTYNSSGILTVQAVEEEQIADWDWVRYGAVINVEEVATLVTRIIRKIENRLSPRKVTTVYVGIGGRSFRSFSREIDQNYVEDVEFTEESISRLINEASQIPLADGEVLKVIPRQFVIDKTIVSQPKGTVGRSIHLSANVITCRQQCKRNLNRLFAEKLKMNVGGYHVRHTAIGEVVLTSDEKRLGCMLIDLGAETTAVSIYKNGNLQYMATIPLGSRNISRDITHLNYLPEKAEELKIAVGNASGVLSTNIGADSVDYTAVNNYVRDRAGEIIANIRQQLKYAQYLASDLSAGIIIVGRGSKLAGFNDRLANLTSMKIRTGSINIPQLRITDSRISPTDACDVLSVLYMAAISDAVECLTHYVPEQPQPEVDNEPDFEEKTSPEEEIEIKQPEKPKKAKGSGWISSKLGNLKKMVIDSMSDPEEDEDMKDDE